MREGSRAPGEATGLRRGLECAAEAVGAEVAALLRSRSVLAAGRGPPGPVPEADVLLALADPTAGRGVLAGAGGYPRGGGAPGRGAAETSGLRSRTSPFH